MTLPARFVTVVTVECDMDDLKARIEAARLRDENQRMRAALTAAQKRIEALETARAITARLLLSGSPGPAHSGNGPGRTIPVKE